jgi:hypothetical protein
VLRPEVVDAVPECALTFIAHCAFEECDMTCVISAVRICFHYLYTVKEMCVLCVTVALFRT